MWYCLDQNVLSKLKHIYMKTPRILQFKLVKLDYDTYNTTDTN